MPEFFNVFAPDVALRLLLNACKRVETETVSTHQTLGRVTAEAVLAPEHLPAFPRSTMDGYAVRARDTFGASRVCRPTWRSWARCGWARPRTSRLPPARPQSPIRAGCSQTVPTRWSW